LTYILEDWHPKLNNEHEWCVHDSLKGYSLYQGMQYRSRKKKRCRFFENVSDCHFETFGYISCLVSGNTLLASDFFAKKLPLIFAECSVKCHQCVICRHNGMGMGAIFQDFTRCIVLTLKGRGQKECKQKRNQLRQTKKNQSQFCLGYFGPGLTDEI